MTDDATKRGKKHVASTSFSFFFGLALSYAPGPCGPSLLTACLNLQCISSTCVLRRQEDACRLSQSENAQISAITHHMVP
jgi:hypothetical protein